MMIRKPLLRPLGDTEYLLEQWGWWWTDGRGMPGYTSPALAMMRDHLPSACKGYTITDELAELVDGAVARLCRRDAQMGDMIWLYYGLHMPATRVGKQFGVSEMKARELIKAGAAWIDCALEGVRQAA